jgi:hypothetical protein
MRASLDEIASTQIEREKQVLNTGIAQLISEINQCVAKLFDITSDELAFICETKASWT